MKRRTSKTFVYSSLLFLVVFLLAWRYYGETAPRRKAQEIWHEHELVLKAAAEGQRVRLDDFHDSVKFFHRLTGISVPSEHSFIVDAMPTKTTGNALGPLRDWYKENKGRIYWDEQYREVRLSGY